MKIHRLLTQVYLTSTIPAVSIILFLCFRYGWDLAGTVEAVAFALVVAAPAVVAIHIVIELLQRVGLSMAFAWMMVFAFMTLMAFAPALLFAGALPGDGLFVAAIGLVCGYTAVGSHALSIARTFKSML